MVKRALKVWYVHEGTTSGTRWQIPYATINPAQATPDEINQLIELNSDGVRLNYPEDYTIQPGGVFLFARRMYRAKLQLTHYQAPTL